MLQYAVRNISLPASALSKLKDYTHRVLHELSFNINFYETSLRNVILPLGSLIITFLEQVSLKFMLNDNNLCIT